MVSESREAVTSRQDDEHLNYVGLMVCDYCMDGDGGECHVPGCIFWMCDAPELPLWRVATVLETVQS